MRKALAKMTGVELREVWEDEAGDFTPWLAEDDNIQLLADAVGLNLEVEAQEVDVGPFRADILCNDGDTGAKVVIENQLEDTDHKHLGQILTYAAGLHASAVIWIARRFAEEHRAAMDWLNDKMSKADENPRFYGVEVELWCVGDSPPAPRFSVVCRPNEFSRDVEERGLTATEEQRQGYWKAFVDALRAQGSRLAPGKATHRRYLRLGSPVPGFRFGGEISPARNGSASTSGPMVMENALL